MDLTVLIISKDGAKVLKLCVITSFRKIYDLFFIVIFPYNASQQYAVHAK